MAARLEAASNRVVHVLILSVFIMLWSFNLAAEIETPLTLPMGDREAFMGNAGVAAPKSPGNIFYNPAGLDGITDHRLTANGSLYGLVQGRTKFADRSVDFDTLASVPNMLAITRKIRSWTYGFGIFSPIAIEGNIDVEQRLASIGLDVTLNNRFRTEEQYIGIASGRNIGRGWAFGLGVFVHRYVNKNFASFYASPSPTSVYLLKSERTELEVLSLLPIAGLQKDLTENFRVGLRVAFPDVELLGRSKVHSEEIVTSGGAPTVKKIRRETNGHYRLPADVTVGSVAKFGRHIISLDIGAQMPVKFDSMPGQEKGVYYNTSLTIRQHLGYELLLNDEYSFVAGLSRSPFTAPNNRQKDNTEISPTNFFGATMGLYTREKATNSGIGFTYANSRQDGTVLGYARDKEYGFQVFGVMLSASINY